MTAKQNGNEANDNEVNDSDVNDNKVNDSEAQMTCLTLLKVVCLW